MGVQSAPTRQVSPQSSHSTSQQQPIKRGGDRSQAAGSDNYLGECIVAGKCLKMLFDYGLTHCSVSTLSVQELGLQVREP